MAKRPALHQPLCLALPYADFLCHEEAAHPILPHLTLNVYVDILFNICLTYLYISYSFFYRYSSYEIYIYTQTYFIIIFKTLVSIFLLVLSQLPYTFHLYLIKVEYILLGLIKHFQVSTRPSSCGFSSPRKEHKARIKYP